MSKTTYLLLAGALVAGAYALSQFGRSAVAGELAGTLGDQNAKDVAASLNIAEAAIAGARKLTGQHAYTDAQRADVYTVS